MNSNDITEDTTPLLIERGGKVTGQNAQETPRAGARGKNSRESVSPEKTKVITPYRAPGQAVTAYMNARIDTETMVQNVIAGLQATTTTVLNHSKGSGKDRESWQTVEEVPDWPMRLRWQEHFVNTVEGMPVKRQEIVTKRIRDDDEILKQAAESPAFAKALRKSLDKIEERSKNGGAENT